MTSQERLRLRFVDEDGLELTMRVKRSTRLAKMKTSYSLWSGLHTSIFRFSFDGVRIKDADTIAGVGLEDQDMVEVEQRLHSGWKILGFGFDRAPDDTSRHFVSPEGKEFNSLAAASKFISFGLGTSGSDRGLDLRIGGSVLKSVRLKRKRALAEGGLRKTLFMSRSSGAWSFSYQKFIKAGAWPMLTHTRSHTRRQMWKISLAVCLVPILEFFLWLLPLFPIKKRNIPYNVSYIFCWQKSTQRKKENCQKRVSLLQFTCQPQALIKVCFSNSALQWYKINETAATLLLNKASLNVNFVFVFGPPPITFPNPLHVSRGTWPGLLLYCWGAGGPGHGGGGASMQNMTKHYQVLPNLWAKLPSRIQKSCNEIVWIGTPFGPTPKIHPKWKGQASQWRNMCVLLRSCGQTCINTQARQELMQVGRRLVCIESSTHCQPVHCSGHCTYSVQLSCDISLCCSCQSPLPPPWPVVASGFPPAPLADGFCLWWDACPTFLAQRPSLPRYCAPLRLRLTTVTTIFVGLHKMLTLTLQTAHFWTQMNSHQI